MYKNEKIRIFYNNFNYLLTFINVKNLNKNFLFSKFLIALIVIKKKIEGKILICIFSKLNKMILQNKIIIHVNIIKISIKLKKMYNIFNIFFRFIEAFIIFI